DTVAVIDLDGSAITTQLIAEYHHSIRRGNHWSAVAAANIHAAVESSLTVEGIDPLPETCRHLAIHGPEVGRGVRLEPVRCRGIARQAHRQADHCCPSQR